MILAAFLPWPFDKQYMQMALAAGLAVGVCAPLIGTFLVQKRLSLLGDGIGHVAFAGVAAGLALGVWPVWTAMAAAVAGAVLIEWMRSQRQESADLALALLFYCGIAGGVVLASAAHANVAVYLFGQILSVSTGDVIAIALVGAVVIAAIALCWRALFAVVLDEEAAKVSGLPVRLLNHGLAVLTAATVVAAMRVVGVLLVAALMVLPVGAAQRVVGSFRATLWASAAIGSLSVVIGLGVAATAGLAAGGTIVLTAAAAFILAAAFSRRSVPFALTGRGSSAP